MWVSRGILVMYIYENCSAVFLKFRPPWVSCILSGSSAGVGGGVVCSGSLREEGSTRVGSPAVVLGSSRPEILSVLGETLVLLPGLWGGVARRELSLCVRRKLRDARERQGPNKMSRQSLILKQPPCFTTLKPGQDGGESISDSHIYQYGKRERNRDNFLGSDFWKKEDITSHWKKKNDVSFFFFSSTSIHETSHAEREGTQGSPKYKTLKLSQDHPLRGVHGGGQLGDFRQRKTHYHALTASCQNYISNINVAPDAPGIIIWWIISDRGLRLYSRNPCH